MAVDLAALGGFIWIALKSDRHWPIFAAAFHLLAIVTHLARTADPTVLRYAYFSAQILWGYFLAFAIGYGAWTAPAFQAEAMAAPIPPPGATRR